MIELIDNLNYKGNLPNFKRDNMTWEEMDSQNVLSLDKGHLVYCTTTEHLGTYIFLGVDTEGKSIWKQIIDDTGSVVSPIHTFTKEVKDPSISEISIIRAEHKCGERPDINTYFDNILVCPEILNVNGDVTVSWSSSWAESHISEDHPLTIKLTGR